MMTTSIRADQMATYKSQGVKNRYRLVNDTYATTLGPDGCAREEGWLEAGTVVTRRKVTSDSSPWTGEPLRNRPSGHTPVQVEGFPACELIPDDSEVELLAD